MSTNVLIVPAIPRGSSDSTQPICGYAAYGIATWKYWCGRHDVDLVVLNKPEIEQPDDVGFPPKIQRWIAARRILTQLGKGARVIMVDADTMARWDTPNVFEIADNNFSAVRGWATIWIHRSIKAYQPLFPNVSLSWSDYFNTGLLVFGSKHLHLLDALISFARTHWAQMCAICQSGNFGVDQTIFNFIVKSAHERIQFLPPMFNLISCFPMTHQLMSIEATRRPDCSEFASKAFANPAIFDFVEMAYVWHFTNVLACREVVMRQTWQRIRQRYPGTEVNVELLTQASLP